MVFDFGATQILAYIDKYIQFPNFYYMYKITQLEKCHATI
jgi:hypothetical protein